MIPIFGDAKINYLVTHFLFRSCISEPAVLQDVQFVSKEHFEALQTAMDMLQDRFASVMREKADLSERCQDLEHINLQLSGETETIGEWWKEGLKIYCRGRSLGCHHREGLGLRIADVGRA